MNLTQHFTIEEFQKSATAKRMGFDNQIPESLMDNVRKLAAELEKIRGEYGKPIVVGSGYRCPKLNQAVGGVKNSDHMYAAAADIHSLSDTLRDNKELWDVIMRMRKDGKIDMRQIIWEYGKKDAGPDWIHCSINNANNSKKANQLVYIGV